MMTQKFSMNGALLCGWRITKRHFWFFIHMFLITILLEMIFIVLAEIFVENIPILSLLISIASWIMSMIVGMGIFKVALKFCDDEPVGFADLFSCASLVIKYLIGTILYGLIVCAGLILLIIPGIIWAVKFQFFSYCIIDKKLGPLEALKVSSRMTNGVKWDLFVFGVVLMLINFVGSLFLGLGSLAPLLALFTKAYRIVQFGFFGAGLGLLLVTIPTTLVAYAFVYRSLHDPEYTATHEYAQIPTPGWLKWAAGIVALGFVGIPVLGIVAAIAIPNLLVTIQRSKVNRTKADMRAIGTALGSYLVDYNSYPIQPAKAVFSNDILPEEYYLGSLQDAWGNGFRYISEDGTSYELTSYGKDGREGKSTGTFDADIIYSDGKFLVPDGATRDETFRRTAQ